VVHSLRPEPLIELRDHLLLSNPVGKSVNSFYYRYTLYPAEVFKPLNQRQIKAVVFPPAGNDPHQAAVTKELLQNDYLPVAAGSKTDLEIEREGGQLRFMHRGGSVMDISVDRFLAAPRRALDDVSGATDHWGAFRGFTFWCVLMAFPIALYTLAFGWLRLVVGLVLQERLAEFFHRRSLSGARAWHSGHYILSREPAPHPDAIATTLGSENWQKQTAAVKAIREYHLDICDFPGHADLLLTPHPHCAIARQGFG